MGNTGVMINMSLIPTAKFNGTLDYDSVEGIDYKRALELRDKYHATAGTICIGVDNVQIKLLLADTTIDYVIPYHKSGMAAHIRKAMHIPTWSEYESYQTEKSLSRADAEKQAKKYGVKLLDASDPNYQMGTSFSEWFDIKEAQQIAKMENANPSDKAKQKKYGVMYGGYMAMQNAANNYLKLCAERGISPKFSHEKADFTAEENYWKLLIDRKMVDNVTGEIIEQQTIKPIFNQGEVMRILNDEVARYPKVKEDQDYAIRKVTEKMLSGDIKGGMSAEAIAKVMKKPVDNVTNVNILASSEDMQLSERDYSYKNYSPSDYYTNGTIYSYDFLTAQKDMVAVELPGTGALADRKGKIDDTKVVSEGIKNALSEGVERDGKVYVKNVYTDRELRIDNSTIKHGLDGTYNRHLTNARIGSVIGSVVKNAIPINGLRNASDKAVGTYAMVSYCHDSLNRQFVAVVTVEQHTGNVDSFELYDVAHAVSGRQKKGSQVDTKSQGVYPIEATTISIAQLLEIVNTTHQSILSEDVLAHFGETRNPKGSYSDKVLFSDRDSYAPTFYSHMGKVIDGIKLEKMGANGVVSYLKGKGVKDEEIKWSGIEAFLEGKKSVTKAELQEFLAGSQIQIGEQMSGEDIDLRYDGSKRAYNLYDSDGKIIDTFTYNEFLDGYVAESDEEIYTNIIELTEALRDEYGITSAPRWAQYKIDGGSNYRELVFQLPNSTYSNRAMRGHWGQDAEGVLAHARIQDFNVNGKKMLFIEELQSDWHNEGLAKGYTSKEYEDALAVYDKLAEDYAKKRRAFNQYVRSSEFRSDSDEVGKKKFDWLRSKMDTAEKRMQDAERDINALKAKGMGDVADAPFRSTYHEYVLKRLLRMAAEEGYDSIGWTIADTQSKRWSYDYEKAYKIEYDQEMPKFLRKYGKKWGATVGKSTVNDTQVWSMDITDSMKDTVLNEGQVLYSDRVTDFQERVIAAQDFADEAREYGLKVSVNYDGSVTVYHGTSAENAEKILTTGIINEQSFFTTRKSEAEYYAKKKNKNGVVLALKIDARNLEFAAAGDELYSPAELRNINGIYTANEDIRYSYSDRDPNAVSHRTLLANALESTVGEEGEGRNILRNYKTNLHLIESEQLKLNEVREQIDEITYKKSLTVDGKKLSIAEFQNEARNLAKKQGKNPDEIKFTLDRDNSSYRASIGGEELMVAHKEFRSREDMDKLQVLYQEARSITTRITAYDKELLRLESMKPIKDVLNREKAKLRKRLEQKGKEAIKAQKERAARTQREIITRYQESRKNAIESRHRTAMREKIKNVVSDLNKLLLHPTKDQHVPIGLQGVVAEALDAINMDTMNAEERVAYYNDLIAKSSDPDEIEMLTKKRDFFEYRDANFKERITALKNAYAEFKESDDPLIRNAHNDAIEDLIKNTADVVGKKSLKDMSLEQLEAVHNMYKAILATVRNSNKLFKEGRQETVTDNSEAVKTEVKEVGGHQDRVLKISKFFKKFGWNMLKPVTAMKVIGSKTFAKLFDNVRAAEDTWAVDVSEAKQFYDSVSAKYGFKKWDFKKRYTFKDSTGADFSLSLEQIMSLYAYSKRAQADKHLEFGGFIFDDAIEVVEKDKLGIPHKYEVNDANPYRLRKEDLLAVTEALTKEQKGFIDEMQTYLSDVMGAKGNEVSLAMYDIKLYNEKDYFPLKTSRYFREFDPEKSGSPKIKNAGFSKKTVPQAGNPIVLANFMDVWAGHVNDMSMYHAFVLPLEDFMRVYNYSSTAGGYDSVQQYIKNAYGSEANQYIERLMDDLNGGARVDSTADIMSKGLALFKKASVFASASVVVQQPSAIARALAYINPKYFVTSTPSAMNLVKHKALWAELKKYAPVAVIKEMGYFDTGVGRSTVDWIKGNQTIKDKVDDVLSKAPAIADELCWTHIWEAVKRETKATTNLKEGSEEFLKKCGTRFTEVITNTQVYDSVLSRSGHMRSKDTGMKMATAFMAEPTTTLNMMVDGIIQGKRGNLKFTAATVGAISSSIILNSLLVSLVYAARDDDEDETYLEKYLASLTTELLDGFNPLTYIPWIKDGWAVLQGFDVERADMTLITKLADSLQQMVKVLAKDTDDMDKDELDEYYKEINESVLSILDNISSLVGIPLKNIRRDFNAIINIGEIIGRADKATANSLGDTLSESVQNSVPVWGWLPDEQKSDKLYGAIVSGDAVYADRIKKTYKTDEAYESAVRKALRENDSRIHEAAQARIDGDIAEYTRIAKEIIAEGYFSQDTVVGAINSEISAINKGESSGEETEDKDEVTSIYSASDINTAFDNGDTNLALTIIDDLIETKVANGMERDKAKSSVRSSMTSYWKPLYKAAYQSGNTTEMERIRRILYSSGLYGKANEVVKTVNNWLKD